MAGTEPRHTQPPAGSRCPDTHPRSLLKMGPAAQSKRGALDQRPARATEDTTRFQVSGSPGAVRPVSATTAGWAWGPCHPPCRAGAQPPGRPLTQTEMDTRGGKSKLQRGGDAGRPG